MYGKWYLGEMNFHPVTPVRSLGLSAVSANLSNIIPIKVYPFSKPLTLKFKDEALFAKLPDYNQIFLGD